MREIGTVYKPLSPVVRGYTDINQSPIPSRKFFLSDDVLLAPAEMARNISFLSSHVRVSEFVCVCEGIMFLSFQGYQNYLEIRRHRAFLERLDSYCVFFPLQLSFYYYITIRWVQHFVVREGEWEIGEEIFKVIGYWQKIHQKRLPLKASCQCLRCPGRTLGW